MSDVVRACAPAAAAASESGGGGGVGVWRRLCMDFETAAWIPPSIHRWRRRRLARARSPATPHPLREKATKAVWPHRDVTRRDVT